MQLQILLSLTWLCHLAAGRSAVWYTDPNTHVLYRASTPSGVYFPYTAARETRSDAKQTSELVGSRAQLARRIDAGETRSQRNGDGAQQQQSGVTQRVDGAPQWTPLSSNYDGNAQLWDQLAAKANQNSPQRSQAAARPEGNSPVWRQIPSKVDGNSPQRSQSASRPEGNSPVWRQIPANADGNSQRRSQNTTRADGNPPQRSQSQRSGASVNDLQRRNPVQKSTQQTQTQQVASKTQRVTTQAPRVSPSNAVTDEVPFDDYWLEDDLKDQQETAAAQQGGNNLLAATEKPDKQNVGNGPSRCVWAIVTCCKPKLADKPDIRYSCFEAAGCSGAFWDSHPCSRPMMQAALQATTNYYNNLPK